MASSDSRSMYLQDKDEVRQVFARFDADSDGRISAEELVGVLKALGSGTSAEEIARMMEEIDADKDGYISIEEFASFLEGNNDPFKSPEDEIRKAFELYDQDNNGKISAKELHKILTQLGEHCSVQDCAGMIESVDTDGDGYVSFAEFRKMMTNNKDAKSSANIV